MIGFTSLKIDLGYHFRLTQLSFLGVYFNNALERQDMFVDTCKGDFELKVLPNPELKLTHFQTRTP